MFVNEIFLCAVYGAAASLNKHACDKINLHYLLKMSKVFEISDK